jgi:phage/plasmid-associated DNA primase
MTRMSTLPTLNNVAEVTSNLLRDSTFFVRLDARRDILSFPNGVVELRSGLLRPRVIDDCLSYVLPYDYDANADMSKMEEFVHSIFEDSEAEAAMQVHAGYMSTGETTNKVFYQFTSPPHAGKSNLLKVISNTLGLYASMADVPIAEFLSTSQFETSIAAVISRQPPLRVLISDEAHAESVLNEELINSISSGLDNITVALRCKHQTAKVHVGWRAKLVFSSNHVFRLPSGAVGTAVRLVGPPLKLQFVEDYDPTTALPHFRPRNVDRTNFMTSDAARPGVVRWLIEGARMYYLTGLRSSPAWDAQRLTMQWKGDVFADWLSEAYFPTGSSNDRVSLAVLKAEFYASHKQARHIESLVRTSLSGMAAYINLMEWEEGAPGAFFVAVPGVVGTFPRARVVGYGGLRLRRLGDISWTDSVPIAIMIAAEARRAT